MRRVAACVVALCGVVGLGEARAQSIAVDHKPVDCIVAGKYARLNACFTPVANVAKARLYFKVASSATWYYVDMKTETPCWAGALPKPKKSLIHQKLQYYVQVFDRAMAEGRSQEYGPTIVGSASECDKDKLVAPLSATGPAAIFPAAPAGFVTGLGATPFVLGGLGVAAAGGTAVVLTKDDPKTTPPPVPIPTPTTTPTPTPPTPPPTPVAKLELGCKPEPFSGPAPLKVDFFAYPTGGTGAYDYLWTFEPGATSTNKNPAYTFVAAGSYPVLLTVASGSQTATCWRTVTATAGKALVTAVWNVPSVGTGTVISTPTGVNCTNAPTAPSTCSAAYALGTSVTLTATCASRIFTPIFTAGCDSTLSNTCTVLANADRTVNLACDYSLGVAASPEGSARSASIRTSLEASGARGRVGVDGTGTVPVEPGGPRQVDFRPRGTHRVEAIVDAGRTPGLWRFDLMEAGIADGSLRVLLGEVVAMTPGSIVFRITGQPSERIAFTFTTTRREGPTDPGSRP